MGNVEAVVALVVGLAAALLVPALVWATVIAGLYQIVRQKVHESRPVRAEPLREAKELIRRD